MEPEGETETDIAEAFRSVLGAERISANDDFFALGGTSISAIKVVAALTVKGYQLAFKDVFSCKTPRVLAAYLRGKADGAAGPAKEVITTGGGGDKAEERQSRYADILDANTLDALRTGERQPVGDVLLTGATGFMGIHFLRELIEHEEGRIYCILRGKGSMPSAGRLRSLMFYYFDKSYEELFGKRIFVIEGDITDAAFFERLDVRVDTVINCAANVKHFSAGDDIEKVNVESVRNLIGWCLRHDARLVHTSTTSVAGQSVDGNPAADTQLTEFMFDFGQSLANQYVRSKYDAEQLILDAIRSEGLNAKIIRMATLSSRNSDGEFQINFRTNGFMGRLRTFAALGCVPFDMLDAPCEFSPIDEVCKASLMLATTPRPMVVFHPCNNHTLPLGDVLRCMDSVGVSIEPVERRGDVQLCAHALPHDRPYDADFHAASGERVRHRGRYKRADVQGADRLSPAYGPAVQADAGRTAADAKRPASSGSGGAEMEGCLRRPAPKGAESIPGAATRNRETERNAGRKEQTEAPGNHIN